MEYQSIIQSLPQDLRAPLGKLVDALQQDMQTVVVQRQEFQALTAVVGSLARSQQRGEKRLDRVEAVLERLAEAQARTEKRVEELAAAQARTEKRVEELAEAQARTEMRLDRVEAAIERLAEAQARTEAILQQVIIRQDRMEDRLSQLVGDNLERKYRERAHAYLGRILRRVRVANWVELEADLEQRLSDSQLAEVGLLDAVVRGQVIKHPDRPLVYLALEVSNVVDVGDVDRAARRAGLLRRAGLAAIPAVAGEQITQGARQVLETLDDEPVLLLQDGQIEYWDEALAKVLG